uniref:Thioredoxin domain-containing protein n=1 Tax=Trichuris muris TaxID=70415 RepID=A0A5S6Q7G0_TRIMR
MSRLIALLALGSLCVSFTPTVILDLDERFLEAKETGLWLVMLYAPWCGHCKRLLPTFDQVARALSGSHVQVTKLDCTKFPSLANKLKVNGYPTIRLYRHGEQFEYTGERTKEAIMDFTDKVTGPIIRTIDTKEDFWSIRDKSAKKVFFLFVDDRSVDSDVAKQYHHLAQKFFHKAYFYRIDVKLLSEEIGVAKAPAILVFKDSSYVAYKAGEDGDLERWFQSERWPAMPLIKHETLYEIGTCCDKYLVVFVLDFVEKRKAGSPVKKMDELARNLWRRYGSELKKRFQLVWFDGNSLANSILLRTAPVPSLFVFNASSHHHYLPEDDVGNLTEEALLLFLQRIDNGDVKPRGGRGLVQRIRYFLFEFFSSVFVMFSNQPLLACCLFGLPLGIASVICYTICSTDVSLSTDEVYDESDESGSDHEKAD